MRIVLISAGIYHLLFAIWANCWPNLFFDWIGIERLNHPIMWRAFGGAMGILGICFLYAARNPISHWRVIVVGFLKFSLALIAATVAIARGEIPLQAIWMFALDDLIWWLPFIAILWTCARTLTGVPLSRSQALSIEEASSLYSLSNGKSLAEASQSHLLTLVFLRHFGCTFTRQILRGLEGIQQEAKAHGSELVLVHMMQSGKEAQYLGEGGGVSSIADPRCELYRAFGLGKGGFLELFGPHVWWRGTLAIFKGCGVGHLAGDGLQMPGAFLFKNGEIIASQRAHSAADLPDLPSLFQALPSPLSRETVTA